MSSDLQIENQITARAASEARLGCLKAPPAHALKVRSDQLLGQTHLYRSRVSGEPKESLCRLLSCWTRVLIKTRFLHPCTLKPRLLSVWAIWFSALMYRIERASSCASVLDMAQPPARMKLSLNLPTCAGVVFPFAYAA